MSVLPVLCAYTVQHLERVLDELAAVLLDRQVGTLALDQVQQSHLVSVLPVLKHRRQYKDAVLALVEALKVLQDNTRRRLDHVGMAELKHALRYAAAVLVEAEGHYLVVDLCDELLHQRQAKLVRCRIVWLQLTHLRDDLLNYMITVVVVRAFTHAATAQQLLQNRQLLINCEHFEARLDDSAAVLVRRVA